MRTLAASSHSSPQYLLPWAAGHPQVSRAHLVLFSSSAMSVNPPIFVLPKHNSFPTFLAASQVIVKCFRLVIVDRENSMEPGDGQQFFNILPDLHELDLPARAR